VIAVIFEAEASAFGQSEYLDLAAELRPLLQGNSGFLSIERYQSLTTPGKVLSLSFWENEDAIAAWRNLPEHRSAQRAGRERVFSHYRLRIAVVGRDYGKNSRDAAPRDSQERL
jgi:heme-degrading monooxygenase HmoA